MLTNLLTLSGVYAMNSTMIPRENITSLGFMNLELLSSYRGCNSIETGRILYSQMQNIVRDLSAETHLEVGSEFSNFCAYGFRIYPLAGNIKGKERKVKLLYFYFDQMRSLVPLHVFEEYTVAFNKGQLDTCYSILGHVYESQRIEEVAYIKALNTRKAMQNKGESGVLFVDTTTTQTYFLKYFTDASSSNGEIIVVPNGGLCVEKFLSFSLYLVDRIVQTSANKTTILDTKKKIFNGITTKRGNTTITVAFTSSPIAQLIVYKYYVYCMLCLEIYGVPQDQIIEFSNEFIKVMFEKSSDSNVLIADKECGIVYYASQILLSSVSKSSAE